MRADGMYVQCIIVLIVAINLHSNTLKSQPQSAHHDLVV